MSKLFDRFGRMAFNTVNRVFAELVMATWVSVDGVSSFTGSVLFSDPTAKATLDQTEYVPTDPYIEYYKPAFDGLKFSVDSSSNEIINISGVDYYVTHVDQLVDGNTFKAFVQLVTSDYAPKIV